MWKTEQRHPPGKGRGKNAENHADPIPFARTDHDNPGVLDKPLITLFKTVEKAVNFPTLRPDAEAIIDDYLK